MAHLKHGTWAQAMQPDNNYKAIDPCAFFVEHGKNWPATVFVQGDKDDLPGSSIEYVERAVSELKEASAAKVVMERVEGEAHMFDMAPDAAVPGQNKKAQAVERALQFLRENV